MPIAVVTKQIKPKSKLWDDRQFSRDLQRVNKSTAQGMKRDYEKTVETWDEEVVFEQLTQTVGGNLIVIVGTDNEIYRYVNDGTRVRRALMSDDFSPKTRPGSLRSRPGSGHVVFISRKLALPGIEARDFTGQITKKWEGKYKRRIHDVMRRARQRRAGG
jgi:hypothetical protein